MDGTSTQQVSSEDFVDVCSNASIDNHLRDRNDIHSSGNWSALTSCANRRDVTNLVQFVNSASNDIKEAMDKSSPCLSLTRNSEKTGGEDAGKFPGSFRRNAGTVCRKRPRTAPISSTATSLTRNAENTFRDLVSTATTTVSFSSRNADGAWENSEEIIPTGPRSLRGVRATSDTEKTHENTHRRTASTSEDHSVTYSEDVRRTGVRRTSRIISDPTITRNAENACDDKRKRQFNPRDSGMTTPPRVLKVEPLNVIKAKSIPERTSPAYSRAANGRNVDMRAGDLSEEFKQNKRAKLSHGACSDVEVLELPNSVKTIDRASQQDTPSGTTIDDAKKLGGTKKSATVNPLPLRKRCLPASFWQEPGKGEEPAPPAVPAETSSRHTAFLPIAPRRTQSIGRCVKDFLGSNLSASEKLELLRLNSIERENYNHLCASRDLLSAQCSSYPCVLMHCKNQHDNFRVAGLPGIPSHVSDYHMHATPRMALGYPGRGPSLPHPHERVPNILGLSYPSISPYFSDMLRHDDVMGSPYDGSRLILPTMDPGSSLFPGLPSYMHPSVVRPVPKKHSTNIPGGFHPLFDVR